MEHAQIKGRIISILKEYEDKIRRIDPKAKVGFRGSASTGFKGPHKNNAPFDPNSFDVDAFIKSDILYDTKVYKAQGWWRSGEKIPELNDMHIKMNNVLTQEFPGYQAEEGFSFRIYKLLKEVTGSTIYKNESNI